MPNAMLVGFCGVLGCCRVLDGGVVVWWCVVGLGCVVVLLWCCSVVVLWCCGVVVLCVVVLLTSRTRRPTLFATVQGIASPTNPFAVKEGETVKLCVVVEL